MAKKKKQSKKLTPLQKQFNDRKKQLDRILKELGKEERIARPKKLTAQYVESLKQITRNDLKNYYEGELTKSKSKVISNRLSISAKAPIATTPTPQIQEIINTIIVGNNIIDITTGEILDTFNEEEFSMVHPDHYKQWFEQYHPGYSITNLESLKEHYIHYNEIVKERFDSIFDNETKGTEILKKVVNNLISEVGSDAFYEGVARMKDDFWMAIDIIAHYGDDTQVDAADSEMRFNLDFIVHELRVYFSS